MQKNASLFKLMTAYILSILMLASLLPVSSYASQNPSQTCTKSVPSDNALVNLQSASQLVDRWLGCQHAGQIIIKSLSPSPDGKDTFEISPGVDQTITLAGTNTSTLLMGFNWYLKYVANADISFNEVQLNLPAVLPQPAGVIRKSANVANRFGLNDTDEGYNDPYEDWAHWEKKIDTLAMQGINQVLVYPGQEAVYFKAFQEFGYTKQELLNWIPQPAHQPWWLMQNMHSFPSAITESLIEKRIQLGRKIADRLRELGMTPVFPGYFGTVPPNFNAKSPGNAANIVAQGTWCGFQRPDWLAPTDARFNTVAAAFYRHQSEMFGDTTMFKMDLLHEGGVSGNVDIGLASKAVQDAMTAAHPGAIWVILGWGGDNPRAATIDGIDKSRMLVLDGNSDLIFADRDKDWKGTPYAFGTIWNFGGHTNLGTSLSVWNTRFFELLNKPGSALKGIALLPEALNNNPAAVEFFTEMAWHDQPLDLNAWIKQYAKARYGASDPNAEAAWQKILASVYSLPATNSSDENQSSRGMTSLYEVEPSLTASPGPLYYNSNVLASALPDLLKVRPELRNTSTYQYDLMTVVQEMLSGKGREVLSKIKEAYDAHDTIKFNELTDTFLHYIQVTDAAAATNKQMMLGNWLENAKRWASNDEERNNLEYDARSIVTVWGGNIYDYARRQYAGLVGDYYYSRWNAYFNSLKAALNTGTATSLPNWGDYGRAWANQTNVYPSEPTGNIYTIAQDLYIELANEVNLAKGKTLTASTLFNTNGQNPQSAVDGSIVTTDYAEYGTESRSPNWMQVDLGKSYLLSSINLWRYYADNRKYFDTVIAVSNDPSFAKENVTVVYNADKNNVHGFGAGTEVEYAETSSGKAFATGPVSARYVRVYANGNSTNSSSLTVGQKSHVVELEVFGMYIELPDDPVNLANGKTLTANTAFNNNGLNPDSAVDGSIEITGYSEYGTESRSPNWMQVDLGKSYLLSSINLWRYYADNRKYFDTVIAVSNDPSFAKENVIVVYNADKNNVHGFGAGTEVDYAETSSGKAFATQPVSARYVRVYANGNSTNNSSLTVGQKSHVVELEVFGKEDLVQSITVTSPSPTITVKGGSLPLSAMVLPTNARNQSVTWAVYEVGGAATDKAIINPIGLLKAVKDGTVKVVATATDGSAVFGVKSIEISGQTDVVDPGTDPVDVATINITSLGNVSTISAKSGTLQLQAAVLPVNAANKSVTWAVYEANGATATDKALINLSGILTAVKDGTVKVVATATDGSAVFGVKTISISGQNGNPGTNPGSGSSSGSGNPTAPPVKEDPTKYVPKDTELRVEPVQESQTAVTAIINRERLAQKLADLKAAGSSILNFEIPSEYERNAVQLPLDILSNSLKENKETVLTLRSHLGSYNLPLSALNREDVASLANTEGATLIIRMDKAKSQHEQQFDQSISENGMKRVSDMIDYKVILKAKDQEVEITNFGNRFITRVMNVDGTIQDSSSATAVVYDPASGELKFVPSVFSVKNGKTEATITRNTNSLYAIVQNKKTFADMNGHWAQKDVETLASKMVIDGTTDRTYTPEMQVTRAQFAALLVRGLGLQAESTPSVFTDVAATQWYASEVGTAAKYGLVQGVGEGQFNPDQLITREQMVVMMMKAVHLVQGESQPEAAKNAPFADQDQLSDYARSAVAEAVSKGLVHGKTNTTFSPQEAATRAEAAVLIKQSMQYLKLIN
ncbi:hypothetical protein GCM10008018_13040 [Paenibacillus marchantiophytorum]|uniref:Alpha-N-acetylglucosaminidase n=1 Tax=Paenibacillus marchantiophytorum TaxID=1619310 RepID=A0ABQ2BT58_9BACL|nr:alpha-N-acetylglucosaminidase TIM-barrel domain-containing protein [Paenibacillus marchantiophytorum]GGI45614.1 hypothetical protein GCM10008018_13040 [Paenibacillus marchantiophytorum]